MRPKPVNWDRNELQKWLPLNFFEHYCQNGDNL